MSQLICGFSKLTTGEKINRMASLLNLAGSETKLLESFWHSDQKIQQRLEQFSENTLSNFLSPFGVVPNFLINSKSYWVPMVTEESSVVAAAAHSAKYWFKRGGFHAEVISTSKVGQIHFLWHGDDGDKLAQLFSGLDGQIRAAIKPLITRMEERGGGVTSWKLVDRTNQMPGLYQILITFETCDAMGANFINSVLERVALEFSQGVEEASGFSTDELKVEIIMSILSNYTPDSLVRCWVECDISALNSPELGMDAAEFAHRFQTAVKISQIDTFRATTHNKGIFNGVDAVVMATGNDFRAVEAAGHTYAARDGQYRGLTDVTIQDDRFRFELTLPLSVGTVGGLTSLHPLAEFSLKILNEPDAKELMMIIAATGLAQNFSAVRSLVTTGIQRGHMRMHLLNILNQLKATPLEVERVKEMTHNQAISFSLVSETLNKIRKLH
ncbi:MAG: hydroxymethylglutaryl-CoA reductase, degradative [Bdellovibrionales bacterium]|nr:hydroxymethylglutaryl-CoA reductase, degradative [Bdellovibrionales bacterium]MBT3526627.1 hydroxymethylglutaryl-CoA reductase, degradative [Bdellovibrionales bacterium]MBT7766645.1 hydroxymethylglutaryl-CoA reductase, degradative [Bdellovibrionales bacterium]